MECACGCGQAPITARARYAQGHWSRTPEYLAQRRANALAKKPNESTGVCACGCGQRTRPISGGFRFYKFKPGHSGYGKKRGEGRYVNNFGYVMLRLPRHPQAQKGYVLEHRYVMEQKLGRRLEPRESVHHVNHDKTDNRPENLELLDRHEHGRMHGRPKGIPFTQEHREKLRQQSLRTWAERKAAK